MVMQLLGTPAVMDLAGLRVRTRGFIELLVFLGTEPRRCTSFPEVL